MISGCHGIKVSGNHQFRNYGTHIDTNFSLGLGLGVRVKRAKNVFSIIIICSLRQHCTYIQINVSPFLFLIVVELLSLHIIHDPVFKGLYIFGREIRIIQLADDKALFLRGSHGHVSKIVRCAVLAGGKSHA